MPTPSERKQLIHDIEKAIELELARSYQVQHKAFLEALASGNDIHEAKLKGIAAGCAVRGNPLGVLLQELLNTADDKRESDILDTII